MNCCSVFGRDSFGEFISVAGGRHLMADKVPPQGADTRPERLIVAPPEAGPTGAGAVAHLRRYLWDMKRHEPVLDQSSKS